MRPKRTSGLLNGFIYLSSESGTEVEPPPWSPERSAWAVVETAWPTVCERRIRLAQAGGWLGSAGLAPPVGGAPSFAAAGAGRAGDGELAPPPPDGAGPLGPEPGEDGRSPLSSEPIGPGRDAPALRAFPASPPAAPPAMRIPAKPAAPMPTTAALVGVGPLLASALVAAVPDPHAFRSGRNLAAWIGLVPRRNSSGGKERLGGITKAGDRYLRQMLVVGAMAVIRYAERHGTRRPWLVQLMSRRTTKVAAVALANKTARIAWAVMTTGQPYREPVLQAA